MGKIQVTLRRFLGWGICKRCLANNEIQSHRSSQAIFRNLSFFSCVTFLLFATKKFVESKQKSCGKRWQKLKKRTFFDLTTYVTLIDFSS